MSLRNNKMAEEQTTTTGGCMCGAVRYEASGAPLGVGYCHCRSCRQHTGAPLVAYVGFAADQVRFSGEARSTYASSPGVVRSFCGRCGSSLTWEGVTQTAKTAIIEFHISTLDDAERFTPEEHTRYTERISWLEVADDLPRYRGVGADGEEPLPR